MPVFLGRVHHMPIADIGTWLGLVGLRMRAVASAVLFFVLNLVGLGLGPLATEWRDHHHRI